MSISSKIPGTEFEVVVPPNPLAPKCRPEAILNTAELFEVREE